MGYPQVLADLDAIDATLAGEPVDPAHAELAELALLLADTAPRPRAEFTQELDARVARRFAPTEASASASAGGGRGRRWSSRRMTRRTRFAGFGGAVAVVAAAAVAVVIVVSQSGNKVDHFNQSAPLSSPPTVNLTTSGGGATSRSTAVAGGVSSTSSGAGEEGGGGGPTSALVPAPSGGGRRVQSAQISLTAPNARISQVSQEVFDVVGQERGNVTRSQVTTANGGNGGSYASFTLSVPTANLQAAMTRLSELAHTAVTSRTDSSQNVSDQYASDKRKIADAQALRTSLLKQLQAATTTTAVTSLEKQIRDAEAQLTREQTALKSLQHRIGYSSVSVDVNAGRLPGPQPLHRQHGFTLHRALHDALHVLVVVAGVALIVLAVAIPVTLILALIVWLVLRLRRRGRERALDQA